MFAAAALYGCGDSAGAVTPVAAPASTHDAAEDVALAAMPANADLIVAVRLAEVHGAASGRILSVAWSNWGARYLRTPVLTDPGLAKIAEKARLVFVGGRFANQGGYEEIVLAGLDATKRHGAVMLVSGGVLERPRDGVFVARWGNPKPGPHSPADLRLDQHAALAAWIRLDRSRLGGLEGTNLPPGTFVRCEVQVDSGLSVSLTGTGTVEATTALAARWNGTLERLHADASARLLGLQLVAERATVQSSPREATGWVALDDVQSTRFASFFENGFAQLAQSGGRSASSIIAGRAVRASDSLDELDCQKSRERIYRRRHDIENGQSVLGIDTRTGEVRNMSAEEAQQFDKNFGEALDDMCE